MNPIRAISVRLLRVSALALMLAFGSSAIAANQNYVLLTVLTEIDFASNGAGVDQTVNVTNNFDTKGNLLDTVIVQNGNFDQVQTTTFTNDKKGNPLSSVILVNNDGAADPDGPTDFDLTALSTFTYDQQGRRIAIDQEVYNDDDELTIIRHTAFTYDGHGNVVSVVTESDIADINGVFDGIPNQIITVQNTWNNQGRLTQSVTTNDINGDGAQSTTGDSVETRVNTFNNQGEVTQSVTAITRIAPGGVVAHATATATFTYDQHGNPTQIVSNFDNNNDGTIDQTNTSTNTWVHK